MQPIKIKFEKCDLGRVIIQASVLKSDKLSHDYVYFKLDSGSDLTTISLKDLDNLGYTEEFLRNCPIYEPGATGAGGHAITLRYLPNISIMFEDREIQGCKLYFSLEARMRSLFGNDILKYFNREINYDEGELRLNPRDERPGLLKNETPLNIYFLENH
ncbi:MAG: hypothetical protein LBE35_08665 [Clostridiales bacterium]|jgi:hypothetical protein|nr:hypothetical protein [Clostridiales bacterium]